MEKELVEFLTVEPRKEFSHFYNDDIYIIPCRIIAIGEEANHNSVWITIERLHYTTAQPIQHQAKCYKRSLRYFADSDFPIETECSIIKRRNDINYIVFGNFHPDNIAAQFLGTYDGKTEEELIKVFKEHYKELNNWIKEPAKFD